MPILSTLCHLLAFCIFLSNFAVALLEVKGIRSSNGRWTIAGTERQHSLGKLEQRWGQTHPFQQVQAQKEHLNGTAAAERGSTSIGPSVIMAGPGDDHRMPALGDECLPEAGAQKAPEAEEEHDEFDGSNVNGSAGGQQCAMLGRHGEPENDVNNKQQPNTTTALPVTVVASISMTTVPTSTVAATTAAAELASTTEKWTLNDVLRDFKMPKMSPIVPNPLLLERPMDLFGSPSPFAGLPMPSTSDARSEVPFPPAPIDIRQLPGFMLLLNQIPSMLNSFTSRTNKDAELLGGVVKEDPSKNNLFPRQPTAVAHGVPNLQHPKHGVVVDQSENGYDGGEAQMLGEKGMRRAKFVLNTAPTPRPRPQFDIERLTMDKFVQRNLFENEGDKKETSEEFFQPAQTVRKKPSTTTTIILSPNKYKVSYNKHTLPALPRQMPSGDDQLDKNGMRRTKGIQLGQLDQSMLNELLAVSKLPDFGQLTQGMDLTLLHKPGGFAMLKQQFIERLQQKAMMAENRKKDYHF